MIVIYLSLHSPYEYSVTIPRTTLSSPPLPKRGKRIPFRIRVKPYALKY